MMEEKKKISEEENFSLFFELLNSFCTNFFIEFSSNDP